MRLSTGAALLATASALYAPSQPALLEPTNRSDEVNLRAAALDAEAAANATDVRAAALERERGAAWSAIQLGVQGVDRSERALGVLSGARRRYEAVNARLREAREEAASSRLLAATAEAASNARDALHAAEAAAASSAAVAERDAAAHDRAARAAATARSRLDAAAAQADPAMEALRDGIFRLWEEGRLDIT